jgi:hypothetical protein
MWPHAGTSGTSAGTHLAHHSFSNTLLCSYVDGIDKSMFDQFKNIKKVQAAVARHSKILERYKDVHDEKYSAFKPDNSG